MIEPAVLVHGYHNISVTWFGSTVENEEVLYRLARLPLDRSFVLNFK
jgi:hypothetical protein